jgi:hypothetical protein
MSDSFQVYIDVFENSFRTVQKKENATLQMRKFGAAAVDSLIHALEVKKHFSSKSPPIEDKRLAMRRMYAARTLGLIGKAAVKASPVLADLFAQEAASHVKREAAIALSRIGPTADEAINADIIYLMTGALNGGKDLWHLDVREAAAIVIGEFGVAARKGVPSLLGALMDPTERIRDSASQALVKLGLTAVPGTLEMMLSRNVMRADLTQKRLLTIGAWHKAFELPANPTATRTDKDYLTWHAVQLQEERALLETLFESGLHVLAKAIPQGEEFRKLLADIIANDANANLRALAMQLRDRP